MNGMWAFKGNGETFLNLLAIQAFLKQQNLPHMFRLSPTSWANGKALENPSFCFPYY